MGYPYKKNVYETIEDEDKEEGDSLLYVGIRFLRLVAQKMEKIEKAEEEAYINKLDYCMLWLYQLKGFYDLIESRTGLRNSKNEIKLFKYEYNEKSKKIEKEEITAKENEKYEVYFDVIEKMIERCQRIKDVATEGKILRYNKDKVVLKELSKCTRELFHDANRSHMIMPEGIKDIKELAKKEWIDREKKKDFKPFIPLDQF